MKGQTLIGVILIIAGVVLLSYRSFTTTEDKPIIQSRDLQVTLPVQESHHIPPAIGWAVLGVGVLLTVVGVKQK